MANTHSTLTSLFTDIADAIRDKTESTASIVADTFPAAIAAIETGVPAVSGTFTATSQTTVTVNGVGFKPKRVFIIANSTQISDGEYVQPCKALYIDTDTGANIWWTLYNASYYGTIVTNGCTFTPSNDGFTIKRTSNDCYFSTNSANNKYYFAAFG